MPDPVPRRIVLTTPDKNIIGTEEGILVQVQVLTLDAIAKAARTREPIKVKYIVDVKETKP